MKTFNINLTKDISGNDLSIKGYTFGQESPRIYIQGGTHGGELTFWIFKELFNFLSNYKDLKGTVTLVPMSNPVAWSQRIYSYTVGKFNLQSGEDWNRGFPGSDTSMGKRRALKIFSFVKDYDYCVDLHTSRQSIPFGIFSKEIIDKAIIKAIGLKYNYLISNKKDDSLMSALSSTKTFGFEVECGSHDSYNMDNILEITNSLKRFLYYLEIIKEVKKIETSQSYIYDKYVNYYSDITGFYRLSKKPGDTYKKGDKLFELFSTSDLSKGKIVKAIEDGVIIKKLHSNILWEGDEVLQTININNLKVL